MRQWIWAAGLLLGCAAMAVAGVVDRSPFPKPRPDAPAPKLVQVSTANAGFQDWILSFRSRAMAQGIREEVLTQAFRGVTYNARVVERDRNQSEFTKQIWEYLDSAASDARVANGKAAMARKADLLERIEAAYGVDKKIVVAIWGLESAYGTFRGSEPMIEALATLAFDGRRGDFFEGELIAALKILQSGDVRPADMTGSWAGAMGHTQFIPTSYLAHAVDFTGDGKRDIWSDDPADALASTAAYLKHWGWQTGVPWGVEVRLPDGFTFQSANRKNLKLPSEWQRLGIRAVDGAQIADFGPASILLPAGHQGAAFMIFRNFEVLERYNTADSYVIGVGHLADRITGGPKIAGGWPRGDRALSFDEKVEMQQRLTAGGFDTRKIDGIIGPLTINAVRDYQAASGLVPDGYASLSILKRLRANR